MVKSEQIQGGERYSNINETPKLNVRIVSPYDDYVPQAYWSHEMSSQYVADALRDEMENWNCREPILIDAPTGKGKNTFICECCIPQVLECNKNLLYVSNRVALSTQQKRLILEKMNSPYLKTLTDLGLAEQENFGNIQIITYHRLPSFLANPDNNSWCRNLMYVVFDESHFFVADSKFNAQCPYLLKLATSNFHNAIRIYMTATSWDILYPLAEAEETNYTEYMYHIPWGSDRCFHRYFFDRDFSRYQLSFFSGFNELIENICKSSKEKWLIFVDSKEHGQKLKGMLIDKNISVKYIDAGQKSSAVWKQLMEQNNFDSHILITTSVLDCGVNINDTALKNIAVMTDSRTSLLQMIGRKRLKGNESVKLWVYEYSRKAIEQRLNENKQLIVLFEEFNRFQHNRDERSKIANRIWNSNDSRLFSLFSLHKEKLFKNDLAEFILTKQSKFYSRIVNGETSFKDEVREWLDKLADKTPALVDKLFSFCQQYQNKILTEAECSTLRVLILDACEEKGIVEAQPTRKDSLKERALSNRLRELDIPFAIKNIQGLWQLVSLETDSGVN